MKRKPIESSSIQSVGYDQKTQVLELEFRNGVYQYAGVPKSVHDGLMTAESAGRYFATNISAKYPTTKL